jgi:hypothetical protein
VGLEKMLAVDQVDAFFELGSFHMAIVSRESALHRQGLDLRSTTCKLTVVGASETK